MSSPSIPSPWLAQLSAAEVAFLGRVAVFAEREIAPHHEQWETDGVVPTISPSAAA